MTSTTAAPGIADTVTFQPVIVRRLACLEPVDEPEREPVAPASIVKQSEHSGESAPGEHRLRREVSMVVRLALEVLAQRRSITHLNGRLSPSVERYLSAAVGRLDTTGPSRPLNKQAARGGQPSSPGLRSLRLCRLASDIVEVSAVWRYQGRHRALAARFEWAPGPDLWRCTALRLG